MKESPEDQRFLKRSKQLLDQSVDRMDADVLRKLRLARVRALEGVETKPGWYLPATAGAALCVAVLFFFFTTQNPAHQEIPDDLGDLELLASSESLEFYDDLEFYGWLAEEQSAG